MTYTILTPEGDTATCHQCGITLTDDNCSEDAWIVWLQHWCEPCLAALTETTACVDCEKTMTGIPGMDWGRFRTWDGRTLDACETCQYRAEAKQAQDMNAIAARL